MTVAADRTEVGTAAARWCELVKAVHADARRRQKSLSLEEPYRGDRARLFARLSGVAGKDDPFLSMVRGSVGPTSSVLDVGAGAGRYALTLAPEVEEVIAVEPSSDLVELLAGRARERGIENVRRIESRWEDAADLHADVVVCYGVIGGVEDGAGFLRKLDEAARKCVFLGLGSGVDVLRDPLWRHFHGTPHPPAPSFLDAVDVLAELGISPQVDVLEYPTPAYDHLGEAVFAYRDLLQLPPTEQIDTELRNVLALWLLRSRDGRLRVPGTAYTYATVSWSPSASTEAIPDREPNLPLGGRQPSPR